MLIKELGDDDIEQVAVRSSGCRSSVMAPGSSRAMIASKVQTKPYALR
ncbi:hypothetical protein [Streptomyces sp. NPDC056464]